MINLKKLQKVYDNGYEALKSIDLVIEEGSLVCLLGPSGCGKTTILNLIAGLLDPTSGDILFDGKSVVNLHPKDRNIGMVFQNYALYPHMSVLENVTFPLRVGKNKMSVDEANKIAEEFMKLTDIYELKDKKPNALSGGQQQRVAIARALVQSPKILLLDEPLSNLDARLRLKIREEIRTLVNKIGVTTVFVTHDQEEALSISNKVALMDQGVIQQYDIPQNLYLNPVNLFVAKFIGNPIINTYQVEFDGKTFKGKDFSIEKSYLKDELFRLPVNSKEYILGIRPEHFLVSKDGPIEVIVDSVEMIGRYTILHFNLEGKPSRVVVDSKIPFVSGQKVNISIDLENMYIFNSDGSRVY